MSACCNLWIVTTACKCSEIRGNLQTILCCSALQLPGHQGITNEPCRLTVDSWPLSAGKGTDAPGEREVRVCFLLQITGVVAAAMGKEGGCSERRGTSLCHELRLDQQECQVPPLGFVRVARHQRTLRKESCRNIGALSLNSACLALRTMSIHQGKSKQIVMSKNVFVHKNYMKLQIKVATNI